MGTEGQPTAHFWWPVVSEPAHGVRTAKRSPARRLQAWLRPHSDMPPLADGPRAVSIWELSRNSTTSPSTSSRSRPARLSTAVATYWWPRRPEAAKPSWGVRDPSGARDGTQSVLHHADQALSNQKYRDLVAMYGGTRVGLLTGDVSINGHAATVVMTTEVLRNMVYEGSSDLANLGFVVLDGCITSPTASEERCGRN